MKKLLTLLALVAFAGSVYAANGWTNFTNKVNNGLNTLDKKEQALNKKIDKAQAERAAQKTAAQKQQEAQKKAIEAKKKEIQAANEANKKAIEARKKEIKATNEANKKAVKEEVGFWKSLFGAK